MPTNIEQIDKNLSNIIQNVNTLDVLLQFEHVLEDSGIYSYMNWEKGEVIAGPFITKYWVEVKLMYPKMKMPEPAGGMRLVKYGCKVFFEEDVFEKVEKLTAENLADNEPGRPAPTKKYDVWIVTVRMPRRLIDDAIDRYLDLRNAASENVDEEDISDAYDDNVDTVNDQDPTATDPDAELPTDDLGAEDDATNL